MRKLSLLFALFAVIVGGCTKNYYGDDKTTDPGYIVQGISDFSISTDVPTRNMYVSLIYQSKAQEHVDISVEGLPPGLYLKLQNASGIPTFSSTLQFYDSSAAVGKYQVKLVANGSVTGRKTFDFNVTVDAVPECTGTLVGTYAAQNVCASGPSNFTENITASPTVINRIILNNFENNGVQLYLNVKCTSGQLTMPSQTINGNTYSGSGYFWNPSPGMQQVRITYTKVFGTGGSTSCSANMSR